LWVRGGGMWCRYFFFFQAEDGIRDWSVTGVQTCALPICCSRPAGCSWTRAWRSGATSSATARSSRGSPRASTSWGSQTGCGCWEIGRASCRGRGEEGGGAGGVKKKRGREGGRGAKRRGGG